MIYRMSLWQNTLGSQRLTGRGREGCSGDVGNLFFPVPGAAYRDVFTLWKQIGPYPYDRCTFLSGCQVLIKSLKKVAHTWHMHTFSMMGQGLRMSPVNFLRKVENSS